MAKFTQQLINNVKSLKEKSSLLSNGNWMGRVLGQQAFKRMESLNKKKEQARRAIAVMPDEPERPEPVLRQYREKDSMVANIRIKENWIKNELFKQLPRQLNIIHALKTMNSSELRSEFPEETKQLENQYENERLSPTDKMEDVALERIRLSQKKFTALGTYNPKTDTWTAYDYKIENYPAGSFIGMDLAARRNERIFDDFDSKIRLLPQSLLAGITGYETEEYKKAMESGDFMDKFVASGGNLLGFVGGLTGVGAVTKGLGVGGKIIKGLTKIGLGERKARIGAELINSGVNFTLLGQVHSTVRGDSWKEHFKSAGVDFVAGVGLTVAGAAISKLPKFMQPIVEGSVWAGIAKAQGADDQTALIQGILFGGMRGVGLMKPSLEGVNEVTAEKFLTEAEKFLKAKRTDTEGIVEAFEKKTKNLKHGDLEYQKAEASAVALLYPRQVFGMVKNVGSFQESRPLGLFGKGKFKEGERPGIEKAAPLPEVSPKVQEIKKKADDILRLMGNELGDISIIGSTAKGKVSPSDLDILITPKQKLPELKSIPGTSGEDIYNRQDLAKVFNDEFQSFFPDKKLHITIAEYDATRGAKMSLEEFMREPEVSPELKSLYEEAKGKTLEEFVKQVQGDATQYKDYAPTSRLGGTLGSKRLTELGVNSEKEIIIYRGIDDISGKIPRKIQDGDFVTTDFESARAYTGSDKDVVSMKVKAKDLFADDPSAFMSEPFYKGSEYIYSTKNASTKGLTKSQLTDIWNQVNQKLPTTTLKTDRDIGIGGEKKLTPEELYRKGEIGEYEYNQKIEKTVDPIVKVKGFFSTIGEIADKYVGMVSTRLANINPEIKTSMRRFEFNTRMATKVDIEKSMPMLKKVKSMDKADRADFDLARKNGDKEMVEKLAKKYGMEKELAETREMLDDVYGRLKESGYDKIQYLKDYFPRVIKDSKGFLEYLTGTKDWPLIQKAIQAHEKKLGRNLEIEEKAALINTLLRGFRSDTISLSEIGAAKTRTIDKVSPDLNQFYMDTDSALLHYINSANESISARKFFGKGKETSIEDSIGMYVFDLIQKGKITPTQEIELTNILKARFNARGPGAAMNVFKNLSYIGAMGSLSSAITQIGDVAFTLYKGGVRHTAKGVYRSLFGGKSKITKQDIGIEKIAQEFEDATLTGKAVSATFKAIGLDAMDTFGKNSFINAMFSRYKGDLNNPKKVKATESKLRKIFGEEADGVIADIKAGKTSENVKFLLFNELSEVQPISLLEVPEGYLKGGNGRVFYMLKTYTVKLFDVYRNEVFKQMANKGTRVEGTKNLIKLTAALMTMNASADYIKDFLFGRNIDLEDIVVDNIFKLFGVSRYITWQARTEGIYSAITKQILPPFSFIDNAGKDVAKFFTDQDKLLEEGFESTQSIPLVGKLYYWWLGKGRTKSEKERIGGEYRPFKLIQDSKNRILTPEEGKEITEAITKAVESGKMKDEQAKRKIGDVNRGQFNLRQIARYKELGYDKEAVRIKVNEKVNRGEITKAQAKDIYEAF